MSKNYKITEKHLKSAQPKIYLLLPVMTSYQEIIRQLTDSSSEHAECKLFRFLVDEK